MYPPSSSEPMPEPVKPELYLLSSESCPLSDESGWVRAASGTDRSNATGCSQTRSPYDPYEARDSWGGTCGVVNMEGDRLLGVPSALCMKASRPLTIACGLPIMDKECCCRGPAELLGVVSIARGCLLLEEEINGGRSEEAHARSKSGAVVMTGPCENSRTGLEEASRHWLAACLSRGITQLV